MTRPIPYETIQQWKKDIAAANDPFIDGIPKIELHVHIEGTLTPALRWALSLRNNIPPTSARLQKTFHSLADLESMYDLLYPLSIKGANQVSAFFDAYLGGMQALRTADDFYALAADYFARAARMNVRYCEVMFDPQAHTRRGVPLASVMEGLGRAQVEAKEKYDLKSNWIMCFLRDMSPADAMDTYVAARPYRAMLVGVGLDGNEYDRPPVLFDEVFAAARADGLKVTAHCDVTQKNTHEHIRQVAESLAGTGGDRIDHGLDAAARPELVALIKARGVGMTLCPWAYVRHHTEADLFGHVRTLYDAGVKINISSDSPAYVESNWVVDNLKLLRLKGGFADADIARVQRDGIEMCWAGEDVKKRLLEEVEAFCGLNTQG